MYRTLPFNLPLNTDSTDSTDWGVCNCKAMYRTLLAWLSGFQMFVLFEVVINEPTFPLSHTPTCNVRYMAFSMRTNTLLTPSKARYFHVTPNS